MVNRLNDRVSMLEDKIIDGRSTAATGTGLPQSPLPAPEETLLLGDPNLSDVRPSDLGKDCSIRTIRGANMDLLRSWINERLDWTPADTSSTLGSTN